MNIIYRSNSFQRICDAEGFLKDLGDYGGYFNNATKTKGVWNQKLVKFEDIDISYETNCYVSVNEFAHDTGSTNSNVSVFKGIYLDTDIHENREDKDEIIEKCLELILKASYMKEIPPVSRIIATGNGLATFFLYDKPIKDKKIHKQITDAATRKMASILACVDGVKQDSTAKTPHRVARIPGTYNESAGKYATTVVVNPDRLSASELLCYFDTCDEVDVFEVFKIIESVKNAATASYYKKMIKVVNGLMAKRGGKKGDYRHVALFCAYNFEKALTGSHKKAFNEIEKLNASFKCPLSSKDVTSTAMTCHFHLEQKDTHTSGFYAISEKTFVEMMGMTKSEIEEFKIFYRKKKIAKIAKNKERKKHLYDACIEARRSGMKINDICEKYKIARSTLNELIKNTGLSKIRSKKSNFSVNRINNISNTKGICLDENSRGGDVLVPRVDGIDRNGLDEYQRAKDALFGGTSNVAIFGKAGVGKTALLEEYIKYAEDKGLKVLKMAPTGLAASNFGGQTAHSKLKLSLGVCSPSDGIDREVLFNMVGYDVIVIDEVGSMRFDYFSMVARMVSELSELRKSHTRLVICGDFMQTFPVVTRDDRAVISRLWGKDIATGQIYEAEKDWKEMNFEVIVLSKVLRQDDALFVKNLEMLRNGDEGCLEYFRSMRNDSAFFDENATHICGHKNLANKINQEITKSHAQTDKCVTYVGKKLGDGDVRWDLNVPKMLTLYAGKKVIACKNTSSFKNGQMGVVTKVNKKSCYVRFANDSKDTLVKPCRILSKNAEYFQMPLGDGYALTVHRVQGQTLEKVVIHADDLFSADQTYVAFSRARNAEDIKVIGNLSKKLVTRNKDQIEEIRKAMCS